ncbi:hypothetical protein P9112_000152 [Eukaryota sp. TZLM1-RC]
MENSHLLSKHTGRSRRRLTFGHQLVFALLVTTLSILLLEYFNFDNDYESRVYGSLAATSGWLALFLMFFQLPLGIRWKPLDRLIGLDKMWLLHRYFPLIELVLVLLHGYLKTAAYPFSMSLSDVIHFIFVLDRSNEFYQRVFFGKVAFYGALTLTILTYLRKLPPSFNARCSIIPYWVWRPLHCLFYICFLLCLSHIKESALSSNSRFVLFVLAISILVVPLLSRISSLFKESRKVFKVSKVDVISDRFTRVVLIPQDLTNINQTPSSFAVLTHPRFKTPHPLSIASPPGAFNHELLISGNSRLGRSARGWKEGDEIRLDGFYGKFCHSVLACQSVLLISGGCGLAPQLSLLSFLLECHQKGIPIPYIKIIFSFRNFSDFTTIRETIEAFKNNQIHFDLCLFFSDPTLSISDAPEAVRTVSFIGRISNEVLGNKIDKSDDIYLCGPKGLMKTVFGVAKKKGLFKSQIHFEEFIM